MRAFAARGKTVFFATHYLEEADAYADRIVLMAHGRIVADGPSTEIKARGRWPDDPDNPSGGRRVASSRRLPGVTRSNGAASRSCSSCADSDAALRALLARYPRRA